LADRVPEDRGVDAAMWGIQQAQNRVGSGGAPDEHHAPAGRAQVVAEAEQTASDSDQTAADSDQTAADSDQTVGDSDQLASDRDQAASDSDQLASDRDFVHGGDADAHRFSREQRDRSTAQRRLAAAARVNAAASRDAAAHARDLAASARDQAAAERDQAAAERDQLLAAHDDAASGDGRAAEHRATAAADRAATAEARARAAADREEAARDRERAARDRLQARADREALLRELALSETDALTGARTRAAGLADLDGEIDRARRTDTVLMVAYVDVVALKAVNDERGHAAGDALLQRVVRAIRDHLRPYDLIVRLGGDEFLCVMPGATDESVHQRFADVQAALALEPDPGEIRAGFATLGSRDAPAELIARADANLPDGSRR
jgi:diguanylate cyclase (GGDEF)-like protein